MGDAWMVTRSSIECTGAGARTSEAVGRPEPLIWMEERPPFCAQELLDGTGLFERARPDVRTALLGDCLLLVGADTSLISRVTKVR